MSTTESVESVESVPSVEVTLDLETVLDVLTKFAAADLFKVIKTATTRVETLIKKGAKAKKEGPKKPTPPQLKKPKAWVTFTLKHAQQHGWEEFIKREKNEEIIMPASELKEGVHVFPMTGKTMTMAQAMSLSKQRYSPATGKGEYGALYEEFSEEYDRADVVMEAPEWLAPPAPIRKTAAEKEAEMAEKKRLAEEKKAQKKEEREKAKEEIKQAKTSEKEAAKASKVPKAAVKPVVTPKAEKEAVKPKAEKEAVKPKAEKAVAVDAASSKQEAKPVPMTKTQKKALEKAMEEMEHAKKPAKEPTAAATAAVWSCPNDDNVHAWNYKGVKYLRNFENEVWLEKADGGCGKWQGMFLVDENRIDDTVENPYDDEEDAE
jgi:hypothetical protein